jgi:hypothetical protein
LYHIWSCLIIRRTHTNFKALDIVFNPETKLIDLTIFEGRQDIAVLLSLQFQYKPSQGFTPIHEVARLAVTSALNRSTGREGVKPLQVGVFAVLRLTLSP